MLEPSHDYSHPVSPDMAHSFLGTELPLLRRGSEDFTEPKRLCVSRHLWQPTWVQRVRGPQPQALVTLGDTLL